MDLGQGEGSGDEKLTVQQQHQDQQQWAGTEWKGEKAGLPPLALKRLLRTMGWPRHSKLLAASRQAIAVHHK